MWDKRRDVKLNRVNEIVDTSKMESQKKKEFIYIF